MKLALRNRIAEWLLEAVASPAAEEPLRALVSFSRRADAEGRAADFSGADAATLLHHGEELFEGYGGGVRLRQPFLGDLEALRARAGRFDQALGTARRRCGAAAGKPEIPWLLCAAAALFDERLFFEVHELLEPAWGRAAEPLRTFLQGLIQVAVGLHHHENGNLRGAASLLADGGAKLEPLRPRAFGVELDGFCAGIARLTDSARVQLASGRSTPLEAPLFPRAAP